jgi:hypothetical protein
MDTGWVERIVASVACVGFVAEIELVFERLHALPYPLVGRVKECGEPSQPPRTFRFQDMRRLAPNFVLIAKGYIS